MESLTALNVLHYVRPSGGTVHNAKKSRTRQLEKLMMYKIHFSVLSRSAASKFESQARPRLGQGEHEIPRVSTYDWPRPIFLPWRASSFIALHVPGQARI
jgi:hypothetical protein